MREGLEHPLYSLFSFHCIDTADLAVKRQSKIASRTLLSLPRKELYCATIQLCWKINIQQEEIQFAFVEDWLMSIEKCLSAFTLWKINYHLINQPGSSMVTSFLRCWILVCVREACSAAVSWTIHPKVVGYPNAGSSPGLIWMDTWVAVAWKMA